MNMQVRLTVYFVVKIVLLIYNELNKKLLVIYFHTSNNDLFEIKFKNCSQMSNTARVLFFC